MKPHPNCDGCAQGLPLGGSTPGTDPTHHYLPDGFPFMACTADRYESPIDRDFVYAAILEVIDRVEACGASPELTHAVTMASDLLSTVGNKWNPPNRFAKQRVIQALGKSKRLKSTA